MRFSTFCELAVCVPPAPRRLTVRVPLAPRTPDPTPINTPTDQGGARAHHTRAPEPPPARVDPRRPVPLQIHTRPATAHLHHHAPPSSPTTRRPRHAQWPRCECAHHPSCVSHDHPHTRGPPPPAYTTPVPPQPAKKHKEHAADGIERQRWRGDPPFEPDPPKGVWECFTQREYPENCTTPRGAAPKDALAGGKGGRQKSTRSMQPMA